MAEDSRTFQEFLVEQRKTNQQLAALKQENRLISDILADIKRGDLKDSSPEGLLAAALPEIINEKRQTTRQIREDAKLAERLREEERDKGVFDVDDILKKRFDHQGRQLGALLQINLQGFGGLLEAVKGSTNVQKEALGFDKILAFRQQRERLADSNDITDMIDAIDNYEKDKDEQEEETKNSFLGALTGALSGASLAAFGASLGKGLVKGGLIGGIGLLIGNYLADNVDNEFLKDGLSKGIPAAAIGSAFGGLPGALAGIAITGLGEMVDFLSGKTDDISTYSFASATLGTAGAAYFGQQKIKALLTAAGDKGVKPSAGTRLGAALLSTPVLVAAGIGISLGVGARFLANKMDEYQDKTLDQAEKISEQIDKDLGEQFAKSETKLLERLGLTGLGDLPFVEAERSDTGAFRQATVEGVEEFREQGKLSVDTAQTMSDAADSLMKISDENLKIILEDKTKARNLLTSLQNLTILAVEDQISTSTESILLFQSKLATLAEGLDVDIGKAYNLDILSQIADIQQTIKETKDEIATSDYAPNSMAMKALKKQLRDAEDDLEELSLVADSMGLGVSYKDIAEDIGAGRLQDLIRQAITGDKPLINTSLQADDAIIESADVDLKNAFIRMGNGTDLAKDLEMAIRDGVQGSFVNIGGSTTMMSNSNSIIIPKDVRSSQKTIIDYPSN